MEPLREISLRVDKYSEGEGIYASPVAGMNCLKMFGDALALPAIYTPCVCVITQGKKEVRLGERVFTYAPGAYLAATVDLLVSGRVTEASRTKPYLCLQIEIDPIMLGDVISQCNHLPVTDADTASGLFVGKLDDALTDCVRRMTRLMDMPDEQAFMMPLLQREFYYRLLHSPYGAAVVQLAREGSHMRRIAKIIQHMKSNLAAPIRVENLAADVSMSPSSFHHHFKKVTAMSPLQYQKNLRLMEARRLMLAESMEAARAAYAVGYESPSQFSREYARLFGAPPMRDLEILRARSSV